jgi:predicted dehydrogenase
MIVYDDIETSEKVKVYDKGIDVRNESTAGNDGGNGTEALHKLLVSYRSGDMYAPRLDGTEALRRVVEHFGDCIRNGQTPLTDGLCGLRVVSVLEAATRSMKGFGRLEPVERPNCMAVSV